MVVIMGGCIASKISSELLFFTVSKREKVKGRKLITGDKNRRRLKREGVRGGNGDVEGHCCCCR